MKRRDFIRNTSLIPVATAAAGSSVALASHNDNEEVLVYIFLRGGIDGLNVVVPLGDKDHEYYSIMRPTLAIPDSGEGAALPINGQPFGFNPVAAPLKDLYDAGLLGIVQATGTPDDLSSRSHFDAEKYVELGTPGTVGTASGWLHRHFQNMTGLLAAYPDEILLPIVAFRNNAPVSLLGNNSTMTFWDPREFRLDNAFWRWNAQQPDWPDKGYMQLDVLPEIYGLSQEPTVVAGQKALLAEDIFRNLYDPEYAGAGVVPYPGGYISDRLRDVAQLIKMGNGTRIFALDYGNFDSHANQDNPAAFNDLLDAMSRALLAFMDDLERSGGDIADKTTVIIQSEFGRRAFQNNSNGTDHGNGNIMLALGKKVNGGQIHGSWPGLYPGTEDQWVDYPNPKNNSTEPELFQGALATTTDFRRVLADYLFSRYSYTDAAMAHVFPGYTGFSPMGVFKRQNRIFSGGFEPHG